MPYTGHNDSIIRAFVLAGERLVIPDTTPSNFRALIEKCWARNPYDRPNSFDLIRMIEECVHIPTKAIITSNTNNQGEWYTVDCNEFTYTLPVRYQNLVLIGHGTYGPVVRAIDNFIHSAGVLLRGLNLANIGIDKDSDVTILNFGLAHGASRGMLTEYIAHRWYHAPEMFLTDGTYDEKVDIWFVGCIMAELILLRPLFPGIDMIDQFQKIGDIIGTPDLTTLQEICTPAAYDYVSRFEPKSKKDLNELFGFCNDPSTQSIISGVSPKGVDFLDHLLSFDPRQRPTAKQALGHPFLETFHDEIDEPTAERVNDENQNAVHDIELWKSIIWQMVHEFVPPSWINDDSDDDL
ncbi:unnamed protein product [Rotaria sordida]|nr:unnamed protein product [Rotaria sordida]